MRRRIALVLLCIFVALLVLLPIVGALRFGDEPARQRVQGVRS